MQNLTTLLTLVSISTSCAQSPSLSESQAHPSQDTQAAIHRLLFERGDSVGLRANLSGTWACDRHSVAEGIELATKQEIETDNGILDDFKARFVKDDETQNLAFTTFEDSDKPHVVSEKLEKGTDGQFYWQGDDFDPTDWIHEVMQFVRFYPRLSDSTYLSGKLLLLEATLSHWAESTQKGDFLFHHAGDPTREYFKLPPAIVDPSLAVLFYVTCGRDSEDSNKIK